MAPYKCVINTNMLVYVNSVKVYVCYEVFVMRKQIKRRTSILFGLALMGLSVNGYAAEVTTATDAPTTAASLKRVGLLKSIPLT